MRARFIKIRNSERFYVCPSSFLTPDDEKALG
jgi:hypothetical protein